MSRLSTWTTEELQELPTLARGQADDLKVDDGEYRVWLSRCGLADGMPVEHSVMVERLNEQGQWRVVWVYDGDEPWHVLSGGES